ncbi:MAG: GMC family oxidoreductase N-terminal domain-containing protein [Burkholderiaceae bacterium]
MASWDTIIIGAGSAGCVLAGQLSSDPAHKVLLLEAGGSDRRLWVRLPIGHARTFRDPQLNWMYQTEHETALDGRSAFWPRGKLLGGSGSINAMAYVRGCRRISTTGVRWAILAGAGAMCCRISSVRRTMPMARGRCLRVSDNHVGQHECADDHGGGESGRDDCRRLAPGLIRPEGCDRSAGRRRVG